MRLLTENEGPVDGGWIGLGDCCGDLFSFLIDDEGLLFDEDDEDGNGAT